MRNPELWQQLQSEPITLSDGSDLGVVLTDRYHISPQRTAALLTEYRRFLYLVSLSDGVLAPSTMVDQLWHLHLADDAAWRTYSRKFFGRELRHIPGRPAPENDPAYLSTLRMIREEFDVSPDPEFWPDPSSRSQKGATSLNAFFLGVVVTALVLWQFGPGWATVAFAVTVVIAVERYIATPSKRLLRRSDSADGGMVVGAETSRGSRHDDENRPGFTTYDGQSGSDAGDGGGCGGD
ncbi:hypothetical protein FQV27_04265 [Paracoccus aurantiacus]|uniref:Glycine-rich domain-containing protein-like n=1 Tax=Paracoccus aurantiacus TaxID=2599412 RepID=A0A5C6S9I4_9RHOB|nr:hypothetical protein [Paracoccus aurantiacus]TXB71068.1 hypothetical protein FQV27_04265 [Paracoccus aurantiacus]